MIDKKDHGQSLKIHNQVKFVWAQENEVNSLISHYMNQNSNTAFRPKSSYSNIRRAKSKSISINPNFKIKNSALNVGIFSDFEKNS